VLPVATYTHFFATVDLRNLFHFLDLRLHAHAQYEIRVYAEALLELMRARWCRSRSSAFEESRA
jgi:thymidylate synthase (FAD)